MAWLTRRPVECFEWVVCRCVCSCVTWLRHMYDMMKHTRGDSSCYTYNTHINKWLKMASRVSRYVCSCVTWLSHVCDMTKHTWRLIMPCWVICLYVWHYPVTCVAPWHDSRGTLLWVSCMYVWHGWFVRVTWHDSRGYWRCSFVSVVYVCMCWISGLYAWHESYVWFDMTHGAHRFEWVVCRCDMAYSYLWHDMTHEDTGDAVLSGLFMCVCVEWVVYMCDTIRTCNVTRLTGTQFCVSCWYVWHGSCKCCAARLAFMQDMIHSCVWQDSFICVT